MSPQDVVIVVPYYTNDLNPFEQISLTQLFRVLRRYPVRFVSPESLDVRYEAENGAPYGVERFPDRFFQSTATYSALCEDAAFYERFADCEYMLIYQTDAFVFADRLLEFCEMGYDYIGAPVDWRHLAHKVGNGGFSLRRISAMLRVIARKDFILARARESVDPDGATEIALYEDRFFAYAAELKDLDLRWPSLSVAARFSMEFEFGGSFPDALKNGPPFGCHAWSKICLDLWWPVICGYGYMLTEAQIAECLDLTQSYDVDIFLKRLFKGEYHESISEMRSLIPDERVRLWGLGDIGQKCASALRALSIKIETVFDRNAAGRDILLPTEENLRLSGTPIIVSTTKYEKEISERLDALGYEKDRDYFLWTDIVDRWIYLIWEKALKLS